MCNADRWHEQAITHGRHDVRERSQQALCERATVSRRHCVSDHSRGRTDQSKHSRRPQFTETFKGNEEATAYLRAVAHVCIRNRTMPHHARVQLMASSVQNIKVRQLRLPSPS